MNIHINRYFLFYWVFVVIFEGIYSFYQFRAFKKKMQKEPAVEMIIAFMKNSGVLTIIKDIVFGPIGFIYGAVTLIISSPVTFWFSVGSILSTLFNHKSKMDHQVEKVEEFYQGQKNAADKFMREEGIISPDQKAKGNESI